MSSRNLYLSPEERSIAPLIRESMLVAKRAFLAGERNAAELAQLGRRLLETDGRFSVQYWEIRDPGSLEPIGQVGCSGALIAVATYLDGTRLAHENCLPGLRSV